MSERPPRPEMPPTQMEAAIEKAAFLENEKEERRNELIQAAKKAAASSKTTSEKKMHLQEAKKWKELPDSEMYSWVLNNIGLWLPPVEGGGSYGTYRSQDMMEMREEEMPEKHEAAKKLIKDIDEYLDQNNLRERAAQIAKQAGRNQRLLSDATNKALQTGDRELVNNLVFDQTISDEEIMEFKKDLYYAMRKRGHSGLELRT